jgi:hypothetical protein
MAVMPVVFDGTVWTHYSQLQLTTGAASVQDPRDAFDGQENGLCGASVPGALFMRTGIHTGHVPVRVSTLDTAPELGLWEEIVEASFQPEGPDAVLSGWSGDPAASFQLTAPAYRARWCASGMEEGRRQDVADEEHPAPDRYALYLWPAPASADAVVRRTSAVAAYWHKDTSPRS